MPFELKVILESIRLVVGKRWQFHRNVKLLQSRIELEGDAEKVVVIVRQGAGVASCHVG